MNIQTALVTAFTCCTKPRSTAKPFYNLYADLWGVVILSSKTSRSVLFDMKNALTRDIYLLMCKLTNLKT